jgi:hypothetical protein
MKKLITIVLLLPLTVLAQQGHFVLTGHLALKNAKAYLYYGEQVDSTALQDSTFSFRGKVSTPSPALLIVAHAEPAYDGGGIDGIFCYVEQGDIVLTGTDSVATATFTGGKVNMEYQELQAQVKPVRMQQKAIFQAYSELPFQFRTANSQDSARAQYIPTRAAEKQVYLQYAHTHPHSLISIEALHRYLQGWHDHPAPANEVFNTLSPDIKNSAAGKDLHQQLQKLLK